MLGREHAAEPVRSARLRRLDRPTLVPVVETHDCTGSRVDATVWTLKVHPSLNST